MILKYNRLKERVHDNCKNFTYNTIHKKIIDRFFTNIGSKILIDTGLDTKYITSGFIGASIDDEKFPLLRLDFACHIERHTIEVFYGKRDFYISVPYNEHDLQIIADINQIKKGKTSIIVEDAKIFKGLYQKLMALHE